MVLKDERRSMATKRTIVEPLTADELRAVIDRFTIEVEDRRARSGMIEAVATSRKVDLEPVLAELPRERLKDLCRKLGLDDGGRDKAPVVARLLGADSAPTTELHGERGFGFCTATNYSIRRGLTRHWWHYERGITRARRGTATMEAGNHVEPGSGNCGLLTVLVQSEL